MHSQVEFRVIASDDKRANVFCRPTRVVEVYPACTAAAEESERNCLDHVDAVRRAGGAMVTPVLPR